MERRFSGVFWKIYDACREHPRYISNRGGTRSGKTFSTLQLLNELIPKADRAGEVTSVVSETLPHLRRGAIRDFETILGHPLKMDAHWNASGNIYTYDNGAKLEFFSVDSADKVLGPARKRLFVNEANHISYETFRQLEVRTTGLILIDYNPASVFWAIEKIEPRENCVTITTTYKDNREFLSDEQVASIEANQTDANWWKVYGLGEVGTLEGLIYDFEQVDCLPEGDFKEFYGMDFGFTNAPTAIVHCLADTGRKIIYCEEVDYRTRMTNSDIIDTLKLAGIDRYTPIYADCAEPKSIEEIHRAGFNIQACDKDAPVKSDKLTFQIQWLQGWKVYATKQSLNLIKEQRNYTWAKDKDGKSLNHPIDKFNHILDALRYGCWSHLAQRENQGHYSISFR